MASAHDGDSAARLLVLAVSATGEVAARAWDAWQEAYRLEDLDAESAALLPSVALALDRRGGEHPWAARLRGIYRHAWATNRLTLRDLLQVRDDFATAGVPFAASGLAVVARYHRDLAARAVDRIDVVVGPGSLERADTALGAAGWVRRGVLPPPRIRAVTGPAVYDRPGHRKLVLRWRGLPAGCRDTLQDALVSRAAAASIESEAVPMFEPADQLLVSVLGEADTNPPGGRVWATDLLAMLRTEAGRLDLAVLWARAREAGVDAAVARGLDVLQRDFGQALPASCFPARSAWSVDGAAAATAAHRPGPAERAWTRYALAARAGGRDRTLAGFLRFSRDWYRYAWNVGHALRWPIEVLRRYGVRRPPATPAAPQ